MEGNAMTLKTRLSQLKNKITKNKKTAPISGLILVMAGIILLLLNNTATRVVAVVLFLAGFGILVKQLSKNKNLNLKNETFRFFLIILAIGLFYVLVGITALFIDSTRYLSFICFFPVAIIFLALAAYTLVKLLKNKDV